jgi:hypothetical protein
MTEPKITHVDAYKRSTTDKLVAGHSKVVHVNPQEAEHSKVKAASVKGGISQEVSVSPGVTFLQEGETAFEEHTLSDGRRIGISAETVELRKKFKEAKKIYEEDGSPEAKAELRSAFEAYKISIAGSFRNYSLAKIHIQSTAMYKIRPRTKEEQKLKDLMQEGRRLGDELGVVILKPIPPYEELMRENLEKSLKTPEDAARYILGKTSSEAEIQKLLKRQKPGWLQRRITKIEIKRLEAAINKAKRETSEK